MTTNYTYDTLNRLTAIEHKDGTTVLDGFYYDLDAVGNITSTTHEDGAFWDYAYDGRYRLTSAVRSNPNETIEAAYSYTYDAGDNLLTKVEPFEDDFNDGNATGWTVTSGTWQASGNYLEPTHASNWNGIKQSTTDADNEVRLRYRINDTSNGSAALVVRGRYVDDNNLVQVAVRPGSVALEQIASGTPATLDTESAASTQDAWYNLRIESDGAGVTVWRWADGELETKVLETASASVTTANAVMLGADAAFAVDFDDVRILADGLNNTTTFAVNNANELTSMADRNGSTTFGFDAWGRMTSKARGSYTAAYCYRYGQMLCSVDSDFPGEGDVTYEYGATGQRRQLTASGTTVKYRFDRGTTVRNEEDASGNLTRTLIGGLADVLGSSPATGDYRYFHSDHLGSARYVSDDSVATVESNEYTPYGTTYSHEGPSPTWSHAMLSSDLGSGLTFAPARYYSPSLSRWLTPDPRGGMNLYSYVDGDPTNTIDPLGAEGERAAGLFSPTDLKPLQCSGKRRDIPREQLEKEMSPDEPLPKSVKDKLDQGCVGLCSAYQGFDGPPEKAPGTKCYLEEGQAKARKCDGDTESFVFAKQGHWPGKHAPSPMPSGEPGQIPTSSIRERGVAPYNYVTWFPETGCYGWMNHWVYEPDQKASIAPFAPSDSAHPATMWCSTCIPKKH